MIGTWRLVEAVALDQSGVVIGLPYGPCPMGRLVLSDTGRMMAVLCDGRNQMPDGETRGYASYCGNYVIEGDLLVTTVDAALIADRIGGDQRRHMAMRGDKLVLRPPQRANGEQRELVWEREGPA